MANMNITGLSKTNHTLDNKLNLIDKYAEKYTKEQEKKASQQLTAIFDKLIDIEWRAVAYSADMSEKTRQAFHNAILEAFRFGQETRGIVLVNAEVNPKI